MANSVDNFTGVDSIDIGEGRSMSLYKAKNVSLQVIRDGVPTILKNFQDGDMATVQKTNAKVDAMTDAQAGVAGAVTDDSLGTATVTVQQGGETNDLLSDLYNSDEVFGFFMSYGDEIVGGNHCMIQKAPDSAFGKAVPTRAWAIQIFDYTYDGNRNA